MSYIKRDKKKVQSKLDALRKKLMNKKSIPKPKTFYSKSINKEIIDKQPLINILTRTSNRPNGFKINLESIHSQTYFNIRHLVTVDSDESEEYVKEYQKEYNFEYIRVNESDYKDVDEIPNPNTGKPFIWNHYFNTLLEKVEKGFIIYLDDDDRFANNLVLEKIAKQIKTQDDIILWQMEFQSGWVVPTDELIGKTPTFCRIGSPCFCYSSKYKDIKWDGWKCGDFRLIKRLYNQIPNSKWIHEVLVKLGNNGGDGKKIDLSTKQLEEISKKKIEFSVVVSGWNCQQYVKECLVSILRQKEDDFTFKIHVIDDGSKDKTYSHLLRYQKRFKHKIRLYRNSKNMGAAYSRFKVLKELQDSNTIIVLVDLDDALQNSALKIVADTYRANENVKLTIGEFKSMNGSKYINGYYNEETVNNQTYHKVKNFKCPALRTFKSEMIKALDKKLFHDHKGKWLMGCTDVALMISLMKQLTYDEISYIRKPIYFYRKTRRNNTIGRFSAKEKKKLFRQITQRLGQTKFENGQYTIANYSSLKNIKGTKNTRIPSVTKIYRRN